MYDFDEEEAGASLMITRIKEQIANVPKGKRNAETLATALYEGIKAYCRDIGARESEVRLYKPGEPAYDGIGDRYLVCFEGGPYQWCHPVSDALADHGLMEPYYSFDLTLYTAEEYR